MLDFKKHPHRFRGAIFIIMATFILSSAIIIQPLGLSSTHLSEQATNGTEPETSAEPDVLITTTIEDPDVFYVNDPELFNRSRSEYEDPEDAITDETTLAVPETDPGVTGTSTEPEPADEPDVPVVLEPIQKKSDFTFTEADYVLYINANTLNLRAAPTTDSTVVATLGFGDTVTCEGENEEWTKIRYNEQLCFVKTEFTSKTMVFESVQETVYVSANTLNLRSGPSVDDEIVVKLSKNDKLTRTGIGNDWSQVKTSSGKTGYVSTEYLTKTAPVVRVSTPSAGTNRPSGSGVTVSGNAGKIVELAYSVLGSRYVYGAHSPSVGFDCSGLTYWAYRQIGVSVPRSSRSYASAGVGVSYDNMRPGDVIGWDVWSRGGVNHVGIYVGNGMMIHASTSKGRVVTQSVSQYRSWGAKLVTIRRFISG